MTEIFNVAPDFGLTVTYEFKNDIHETFLGDDYINARWKYPLAKYNFSMAWFEQSVYDYVKDFFLFVKGSQDVFLFEDPIDNFAYFEEPEDFAYCGKVYEYEGKLYLAKKYKIQNETGEYSLLRPITRPKEIILYEGITPVTTATINYETGEVSGVSVNARWKGTFYVPVRFENDTIPMELLSKEEDSEDILYRLPDLRLVEVRDCDHFPNEPLDTLVPLVSHYFIPPIEYGGTYTINSKTDIFSSDSGWEKRDSLNNDRLTINTNLNLLSRNFVDYLVTLWRVTLGGLSQFRFADSDTGLDIKVRFTDIPTFKTVLTDEFEGDWGYVSTCENVVFKEEISEDNKSTYCLVWIIKRRDEVTLGFTNHDRPVTVNEIVCSANVGFTGTASQKTAELNTDSTELNSIFLEITEDDLLGGLYDNADLIIYIYDWVKDEIVTTQFNGTLGGYSIGYLPDKAKQYQIEALSLADKLDVSVNNQTSSECRHLFLSQGYGKCNKAIGSDVRVASEVTGIVEPNILEIGFGADNWEGYKFGILEFTSGKLKGTKIYITETQNPRGVSLLYAPNIPPEIGDTVLITKHCNKTVEACKNYNNLANYGGFPRLPGIDLTISGADT